MTEGRAIARYVRTSTQKAGLVLDLIRGRDVSQALATLRFARKGIARDIEKVLQSAVANAQQKQGAGGELERLYVAACYAGQGPSAKRIRPAPMGRAYRVVKRTAHLTVHVAERPERAVIVTKVESAAPAASAKAGRGRARAPGKKPVRRATSTRRRTPSSRARRRGASGGKKKNVKKS